MSRPTHIQDYKAIVEVLSKYCAGCVEANSSAMQSIFAAQATFFGTDADNNLTGGSIQGLFNQINASAFPASPEAQTAVVNVDIVGTAASARVDMNDIGSGFCFTDFFHLLKVQGQWTVVGKIFHAHMTP